MDNKFKELFYIATGWVVASKQDIEIIIEEIIKEHPELREKGKNTIDDVVSRSNTLRADIQNWSEETGSSLQQSTENIKEDLSNLLEELIQKPKMLGSQVDKMAHQISAKTKASYEDVSTWLHDLKETIEQTRKVTEGN